MLRQSSGLGGRGKLRSQVTGSLGARSGAPQKAMQTPNHRPRNGGALSVSAAPFLALGRERPQNGGPHCFKMLAFTPAKLQGEGRRGQGAETGRRLACGSSAGAKGVAWTWRREVRLNPQGLSHQTDHCLGMDPEPPCAHPPSRPPRLCSLVPATIQAQPRAFQHIHSAHALLPLKGRCRDSWSQSDGQGPGGHQNK